MLVPRPRLLSAPDVTRVADGLRAANEALTFADRLRALFHVDPLRRAARLRGRAAKLLARAEGAPPKRAARLRAKAAGLLAEAEALEAACGVQIDDKT